MAQNHMVVQAVIQPGVEFTHRQMPMYIALFNEDGTPYTLENGGQVVLTGYAIADAGAAIAPTDTVNEALGKLEKRVATLETAQP